MFCRKCGTQIEDGCKVCPACGAAVASSGAEGSSGEDQKGIDSAAPGSVCVKAGEAGTEVTASAPSPEEGKKRNVKAAALLGAAVLVCVVVVCALFASGVFGKKEPIVGRWEGLGGVLYGEANSMMSDDFYVEMSEDGRFHLSFFTEAYDGAWRVQSRDAGEDGDTFYFLQTETEGTQNFYATVSETEGEEQLTLMTEDSNVALIFGRDE